jgi:hypothetical protein
MLLSAFADGFNYGLLRDTLVMTYARLLVQEPKNVKAVSKTVKKCLAAVLSGGGRVAAAGLALVDSAEAKPRFVELYVGVSD